MEGKRIGVALGLLMAAALIPLGRSIHAQTFSDVPRGHWAYDAIEKTARLGLVLGPGDGSFQGDKPPSRYELAMAMAKVLAEVENRISVRGVPDSLLKNLERLNLHFAKQIDRINRDLEVQRDAIRELYRREGMKAPF